MNHTARILIVLITAWAAFLCYGKRFHISNGKNDFPLCTQQQIDLHNNNICKALKNTEGLQCTRKINVYHIFQLYREYAGTGDFFKGINIEPTGNFKIQTLYDTDNICATSVIIDKNGKCAGIYGMDQIGVITIDRNIVKECAIDIFAVSQKVKLGILFYFKVDFTDVMGVDKDGNIYVFWDDNGKPTVSLIKEFPEEALYNKFDYYKKPGLVKELQQFFRTKVLDLNETD